jgi:hypothetical protein
MNRFIPAVLLWISGYMVCVPRAHCQQKTAATPARLIILAEPNGIHRPFVDSAIIFLKKLSAEMNFSMDFIENADSIGEAFLSRYRLFIQLDYPPYRWTDTAKAAFEKFIKEGKISWLGFHHATLLGEFDGFPIWPWFSEFMGGIRWKNYIAGFASAELKVEQRDHPVTRGLPSQFTIAKEEWYTYDKSPRPNVTVLISANESSYKPASNIRMGDHPVVWTNPHMKAKNLYIFMGHHGQLFDDPDYRMLFRNSLGWLLGRR